MPVVGFTVISNDTELRKLGALKFENTYEYSTWH